MQRKAGLRFFSNANLKTFIDNVLPRLLHSIKAQLDEAARGHTIVDLQDTLLELITRLIGNVAYDMDIPASLPFGQAFGYASGVIGDRFQNPFSGSKSSPEAHLFERPCPRSKHLATALSQRPYIPGRLLTLQAWTLRAQIRCGTT